MSGILPNRPGAGLNKTADLRQHIVANRNPDITHLAPANQAARAMPRLSSASGGRYFWQGGSLWIGSGHGRSDWHEHHAHQLALGLDGEFAFRTDPKAAWTYYTAAIVPSHCTHEFELERLTVAHLFVEPESLAGRALSQRYGGPGVSALPEEAATQAADGLLRAYRQGADAETMKAVARAAVAVLAGLGDASAGPGVDAESTAAAGATPIAEPVDPRVARALDYLRSRVREPVSLADAAAAVSLSPSRFRHLFVQQTGTSFRAYLLWLRINVAIESTMAGASWTEAAHRAGFADSSHLARTHKRMFGIEPTAVRHE